MERIASFCVDHRTLEPGIYISRIDGDITTYDLRFRKPNTTELISNEEMHSTEHLFATIVRNSDIKDNIIYFGPMGCQTGYYLLVRDAVHTQVIELIKNVLLQIIDYEGDMPGKSEAECGNYANLNVECAKHSCSAYYDVVRDLTEHDLNYQQ